MFELERSIRNWLRLFRKHHAFNHGSIREMELHIRDHIDDLVSRGFSEEDAFNTATRQFGDIDPMAREEYWNLLPRSTFNTNLNVAMFKNYLKIAVRNFLKSRFYSLVNILGLTIGLTIVFLIGIFVADELSFDQYHLKKDSLYRVVENQYYADQAVFPVAVTPSAIGPSLKEKYPEIIDFTRIFYENNRFETGDRKIREDNGIVVDADFFRMFSYPLIEGSLETFEQNLNSLILNKELSEKYFEDKDPIGELITLSGEQYEVVGIIDDVPSNTHLPFRYVKNFKKYAAENPDRASNWNSNWIYTYVELSGEADLTQVNDKIKGLIKENNEGSVTDVYLQPLTNIYLGEVDFTVEARKKGEMQYVRIFTVVAIFILLISCINFMNLSTARSAKRAKEVGLRKTVGAARAQLIIQFLAESILMSVIAVLLSILLIALILPYFNLLSDKQFEMGMLFNPESGLMLVAGILIVSLITGFLAGGYPAIFLSSLKPVSSLKSESNSGRGSGLRKVLVVFQFAISVILIIGTVVVYEQLGYIQNKNLGYDRENVILVNPPDRSLVESFSNELRTESKVIDVGSSNSHPAYVLSSTSGFSWRGKDPESSILIHLMGVDENFLQTMGMKLREGRNFTSADSLGVIINEKALEVMGFEDPVGEVINDDEDDLTVIGVVRDFNFKSIHTAIEPLLIYKTDRLYNTFIRVSGNDTNEALAAIKEKWSKFFPGSEFDYNFLDEDFENLYKTEKRTQTLSTYFAALAIFISCLGLFGLVSYASEQRTKEIGIRKVLGASVHNLFLLLTGDFTRLVMVSLIVSIPAGWFLMNNWLQGFAYHIDLSIWVFILSGLSAILIALVTVSYQSIRVSISNPVNALRNE